MSKVKTKLWFTIPNFKPHHKALIIVTYWEEAPAVDLWPHPPWVLKVMGVGQAPMARREDWLGYCACQRALTRGDCACIVPGPAFMQLMHRLCAGQAHKPFLFFYSKVCSVFYFGIWDHPHHLIQWFSLPLSKTYIISFGDLELALKIEILIIISEKNFSLLMRQVSMFSPFGFSMQWFLVCFFICQKPAFVCEF